MRTAEQIAAAIGEAQKKRAALSEQEKAAAEKETAARQHLAAVQDGNAAILSKNRRLSTKNTDWLFGILTVLIAAAVCFALVRFAPFFGSGARNAGAHVGK